MELQVEVIRVGEVTPHDNADTLDIVKVFDYPVVTKRGNFAPGDLAVYVPIDAVVPFTKGWEWLHGGKEKNCRVQAKRLRGVFSMGLLVPMQELVDLKVLTFWEADTIGGTLVEGSEISKALGITKYEPPVLTNLVKHPNPIAETDLPYVMPKFTDIENIRRWPNVFEEGEMVVMTEKIHGANFRVMHDGLRLYVGSHNHWLKPTLDDGFPANNMYAQAARDYNLEESLKLHPGMIFFGELYGSGVQDLTYGCAPGERRLAFYDALNVLTQKYLDWEDFLNKAGVEVGLPIVPIPYWGPFSKAKLEQFTTGPTQILARASELGAIHNCALRQSVDQIREGVVVRPVRERFDHWLGRVALKSINPDYLLRKGKPTETKEFLKIA